MKIACLTDQGRVRPINEDNALAMTFPDNCAVLAIADGMGGHNAGEVASGMVISGIQDFAYQTSGLLPASEPEKVLNDFVQQLNRSVYQHSLDNIACMGMGTTLTVACFQERHLIAGHIGDSRLYLYRHDALSQITQDHTYVEELVRQGSLSREEASTHPRRHVITRAIGCAEDVETDIIRMDAEPGDIWLICSDGLSNMVHDHEISQILKADNEPEALCRRLIERALEAGGDDNISVAICTIDKEYDSTGRIS